MRSAQLEGFKKAIKELEENNSTTLERMLQSDDLSKSIQEAMLQTHTEGMLKHVAIKEYTYLYFLFGANPYLNEKTISKLLDEGHFNKYRASLAKWVSLQQISVNLQEKLFSWLVKEGKTAISIWEALTSNTSLCESIQQKMLNYFIEVNFWELTREKEHLLLKMCSNETTARSVLNEIVKIIGEDVPPSQGLSFQTGGLLPPSLIAPYYALIGRRELLDFAPGLILKLNNSNVFITGAKKYITALEKFETKLPSEQKKLFVLSKKHCKGIKNLKEYKEFLTKYQNISDTALETLQCLVRVQNSALTLEELTKAAIKANK